MPEYFYHVTHNGGKNHRIGDWLSNLWNGRKYLEYYEML